MKDKPPAHRGFSVEFRQTPVGNLVGRLFLVDHGDGASTHVVSGRVQDGAGTVYSLHGTVSGLRFEAAQSERGAPKKTARNVAAYLALCYFLTPKATDHRQAEANARREVLKHWSAQGWRGMPDESAMNKLIRAGRRAVQEITPGGGVLRMVPCSGSAGNHEVVAMALAAGALRSAPFREMRIDGDGWAWSPNWERAEFGRLFTESISLT